MAAASLCELAALAAHTPSPLTRDFIRIGRVSYWGDTQRMRDERGAYAGPSDAGVRPEDALGNPEPGP
jgi:hypothetical protein